MLNDIKTNINGRRQALTSNVKAHRVALFAVVGSVTATLLLVVGAWAYDTAQKDQIAPGVRIGGIDVGGRSVDEARDLVKSEVVAPLRRPLTVSFEDKDFRVTSRELEQRADIDGMLDEAIEASREGGIVSRMGRYFTGSEVDADVPADVTYSEEAVDRFVAEIGDEVNQDPVDASIIPSGDELQPTPGHDGVELRGDEMRDIITEEIESPAGGRAVRALVRRTRPEITTNELRDAYPTYVTIDRANYTLRLFKNLELSKSYPIAVGQAGLETPSGLYTVQDKQVNPYWYVPESDWAGELAGTVVPPGPSNPLQARWIGIAAGAGIHGTTDIGSLGTSASHGCVRMAIPDVIELYDRVPMGTPIYVS
jgi:lipoprotein-anchoring transpeptidase ErfK/SrfK